MNSRFARIAVALMTVVSVSLPAAGLERLAYNSPGLTVDLGVGLWAWPMPMDWDKDGDLDLVVACPDKPYNGVYFFENPGDGKGRKFPVFKAANRVGGAGHNLQVSFVNGEARVLREGYEHYDFRKNGFTKRRKLVSQPGFHAGKTRARMWRYVDYDGDDDQDLVVGIGDWSDYVWDHAHDAKGAWHNGPLHGFVYLLKNEGSDAKPDYAKPRKLTAGGDVIDVYGWPSPNFADFDGDGDLDLLCGEFLDGFTYFENEGSRSGPRYAKGRKMRDASGAPLVMDLQMITPTAIDWDGDGDQDLIVGDEDGRVALIEHTGKTRGGTPQFLPPVYFQQEANTLKFGALATPFCVDWDGDGDEDIICGNTAGYVGFFENLSGGVKPKWARVRLLKAGGETLRIQAGPSGSIQGPCEAKWGYTTLSVADWDHDGRPDVLLNSIWGRVLWCRNVGSRSKPELAEPAPLELTQSMPKPKWFWWKAPEKQLVTQWRTTPMAVDFTGNGLTDLVMLDSEGYLCLYERAKKAGKLVLHPPKRVFVDENNRPFRLNARSAGRSGRFKIAVVDWDGDGRLDVLVNSENATWYRNAETRAGRHVLKKMGNLGKRNVAGHTSSPTVCDFDMDGRPDLLVGAEDGRLYFLNHHDARTWSETEMTASRPKGEPKSTVAEADRIFIKAPFKKEQSPSVVSTSRGMAAAWRGKDGTILTAYDDGAGWSRPARLTALADASKALIPVLVQSKNGFPLQLVLRKPGSKRNEGKRLVSYDRGRSFRQPVKR